MRGKRGLALTGAAAARNIPAYAGKTYLRCVHRRGRQEHPRVCGENGSSLERIEGFFWNIPAYAGKTPCGHAKAKKPSEHPRVCGENSLNDRALAHQKGTSPRMRGKQDHCAPPIMLLRNIPAYAGKTRGLPPLRHDVTEHPRVCGENKYASWPIA